MSAAKKFQLLPEEQFIEDALKAGRCRLVGELSMKALGTPDVRLQGRVKHLDVNHCHWLDKQRQLSGSLSPVVVFEDEDDTLRLADGFHRHDVYRRAGLASIPAYVIKGGFDEAAQFAAMCNRRSNLGKTPDDFRKSVEILLDVEECREWSICRIARHIGISGPTVSRTRAAYFAARKLPFPGTVERSDGVRTPSQPARFTVRKNKSMPGEGQDRYRCTGADGNSVYLGSDYESALSQAEQIRLDDEKARRLRWDLSDHETGRNTRFSRQGVSLKGCGFQHQILPGLWAYTGHGRVVVWTDLATPESLPLHAGIVLGASEVINPALRAVVVCYHEDAAPAVLDIYRRIGIEFRTPEELIAEVAEETGSPS